MTENYPLRMIWERIRKALRRLQGGQRTFEFDQDTFTNLQHLAERERRSPDELASDLLSFALQQQRSSRELEARWQTLSAREQQVAALICLGLTNPEIAARLTISSGTVKTHVRNVLRKFDVHSKDELRAQLSQWDFSAWDE